jgi:hypothetical protein
MRESFAMQKTIRIYAKVHPNYEPRKHPWTHADTAFGCMRVT